MDGGFFWSDGWSWNASILSQGWLWPAAAVILGVFIVSVGILVEASSDVRAKRRRNGGGNARTLWRSSMWSWDD